VRVSRVWQLFRRVTYESVRLAFGACVLSSTVATVDEGQIPTGRILFAQAKPPQGYGSAQDSRYDQETTLAYAGYDVGECPDSPLARSTHSSTWIVTTGDLFTWDQLLFLTSYRGRPPP
jgi:hypothetical protein